MRSKEDPIEKAINKIVDMFGILGTGIILAATLYRVLFMLASAFRPMLITDLIIILLMGLFYLWRRL